MSQCFAHSNIQLNVIHVEEVVDRGSISEPVSVALDNMRGFSPMQNSRRGRASPWDMPHLD